MTAEWRDGRWGRLDRPVLMSSLVSGALWLVALAVLTSWALALTGAAYVLVASLVLAAAYGRPALARGHEIAAWAAPWLAAVALWTVIAASPEGGIGRADLLPSVWFGLVIGTGSYLAWQVSALAVRQVMRPQDRAR